MRYHWQGFRDYVTRFGLVGWGTMIGVVVLFTLIYPDKRTVTIMYRFAAETFAQGGSFYPQNPGPDVDGFLYLPGFAVLYLPFDWVGPRIGDTLWKLAGLAMVTWAAWSNCRELSANDRRQVMPLALAMSIPLISGSFLNGQSNLHMVGAVWLATLSAFRGQSVALVFWSGVAVLAKPLAIVGILLIAGVRPRTLPALAAGLCWAVALPFAFADARYVFSLYTDCWQLLTVMGGAERLKVADFTAIFHHFGWLIGSTELVVIRCLMAVVTLLLALFLCKRLGPNAAALQAMVLGASYMCLFNPRAEEVTYSIVALPFGVAIAIHYLNSRASAIWHWQAAILVLLGCNGMFGPIFRLTNFWLRPALVFLLLILMAMGVRKTWASDRSAVSVLDAAGKFNAIADASKAIVPAAPVSNLQRS